MEYKKETSIYNDRRYGRPYIALCDEKGMAKAWGTWVGTEGFDGELILNVPEDYCIVMSGQKDFRNVRNCAPSYALLFEGKPVCLAAEGEREYYWTINKMTVIKLYREKTKDLEK